MRNPNSICKTIVHWLCLLFKTKVPDEVDEVAEIVEQVVDEVIDIHEEHEKTQ